MSDPIEDLLKRHARQNERIITLLEQLVALTGGPIPEKKPEPTPVDTRSRVSVVPRGPLKPRFSAEEMQSIHAHERSRYE